MSSLQLDPAIASPKTVLVVDDSPNTLSMISQMINIHGYRTITAKNAAEALSIFTAPGATLPDALWTDLEMPPGIDGFQLATEIRRIRPNIPVIINSAADVNHVSGAIGHTGYTLELLRPVSNYFLEKTSRGFVARSREILAELLGQP